MAQIELTSSQYRKIERAVKALNDVRSEIQKQNPSMAINWYLEAQGNLNLMEDKSHVDDSPNHDAVIDLFYLDNSSGGGW